MQRAECEANTMAFAFQQAAPHEDKKTTGQQQQTAKRPSNKREHGKPIILHNMDKQTSNETTNQMTRIKRRTKKAKTLT
jgi:hypothetical protein